MTRPSTRRSGMRMHAYSVLPVRPSHTAPAKGTIKPRESTRFHLLAATTISTAHDCQQAYAAIQCGRGTHLLYKKKASVDQANDAVNNCLSCCRFRIENTANHQVNHRCTKRPGKLVRQCVNVCEAPCLPVSSFEGHGLCRAFTPLPSTLLRCASFMQPRLYAAHAI